MFTITRRLHFDYGHRVYKHESKCKFLHGHRGILDVDICAEDEFEELDELGRVLDFGKIKDLLQTWVDNHWDHGLLLNKEDPILKLLQSQASDDLGIESKIYTLPYNPTAENMAMHFYHVATEILRANKCPVYVDNVRMHETPNCIAHYLG